MLLAEKKIKRAKGKKCLDERKINKRKVKKREKEHVRNTQ
jgi:hypothetical protein